MKKLRPIFAVLLLLGASYAQKTPSVPSLPAGLPPSGPLKPVTSPAVEERQLDNGMRIWLVQRPELPKVAFTLLVRGGDSFDPASAPGLARLMAQTLTQGTASASSREIAEEAQGAGGDLTATAGPDATEVSLDSLSEHALDAVALVADVARNPSFADKEVDLAKSNMEDELRSNEARPGFLARRAWYQITYGDHPYHIMSATMKTLESATPESLRALYAESFQPDQALLVVVGSFDRTQLLAQIQKAFGPWKRGAGPGVQVKEPAPKTDHKIYFVERPGSVQTTMLLGAVGPTVREPDEPALKIANTIYGGSFGSRLTRNIREDKGYTYSPYSFTNTLRWSGVILTSEDVRNEVTGPSLKETFYELKRIATEPPSSQELDQAKRYLIGNIALSLQSRVAVAAMLGKYWVDDEPATHLTEEMAALQKASVPEVAQAAAKYLAPDRMTVVAVGEKAVILEQLKPFGMQILPAPKN